MLVASDGREGGQKASHVIGAWLVAFRVVLCSGVVEQWPGLTARFIQLWKLGLDDTLGAVCKRQKQERDLYPHPLLCCRAPQAAGRGRAP